MAVNFVLSIQVLAVNGVDLSTLNFTTGVVGAASRNIPCIGSQIVGPFWRIPIVSQSTILRYSYANAVDATPPTADAVKILRIKYGVDTYDIAIANTDAVTTTNTFGTLCDGLGGSLATMASVTIPFPIFQNPPTATNATTGTKTFTFPFPTNPNGVLYAIPQVWFNGVAPSTPYAPAGITTAAQFVTWATTNWSTYGTWASAGDIVTLASPTSAGIPVTAAGMLVSLAPAAWCFDLTTLYPAGQINANALNAGGTGYAVNDTFTVNTGSVLATGVVNTVSSGAVATYTLTTKGAGYSTGTGVATTKTSGAGTGFTIDITTVRSDASVVVSGVAFGSGPTFAFGAFSLNNTPASIAQLITAIRPFLESTATIAIGGTGNYKVNVSTVQATPKIYDGVTLRVTAGAGACS